MCIIAYCRDRKLTKEEFDECFSHNSDGMGIAWASKGKTHYLKGFMEKDQAWGAYNRIVPVPRQHVVHFRIGTSGPKCHPLYTHPFIVSKESPLQLSYSGMLPLLFHNGCMWKWEKHYHKHIKPVHNVNAEGEVNDSRYAAIMTAIFGLKTLNNQSKFVILTPDTYYFFGDFVEENGIKFSNSGYRTYTYTASYSGRELTDLESYYQEYYDF